MANSYRIINPYNNEQLGNYDFCDWPGVERVLDRLQHGEKLQRGIPAHQWADILRRLAGLMEQHSEQLAALITAETGKTISDSRVEMVRAINTAIASSEEARQISGEALDSDAFAPTRGRIGVVCWRPLGTVLCITPFNFPINIAMHKIGPAFAAGNAIFYKPGPQNTASARLLTDLCYQAGIPEDVLQMAVPDIVDMPSLIAHSAIDAINFTGGSVAADAIAAAAGYKKLLLELGGQRSANCHARRRYSGGSDCCYQPAFCHRRPALHRRQAALYTRRHISGLSRRPGSRQCRAGRERSR